MITRNTLGLMLSATVAVSLLAGCNLPVLNLTGGMGAANGEQNGNQPGGPMGTTGGAALKPASPQEASLGVADALGEAQTMSDYGALETSLDTQAVAAYAISQVASGRQNTGGGLLGSVIGGVKGALTGGQSGGGQGAPGATQGNAGMPGGPNMQGGQGAPGMQGGAMPGCGPTGGGQGGNQGAPGMQGGQGGNQGGPGMPGGQGGTQGAQGGPGMGGGQNSGGQTAPGGMPQGGQQQGGQPPQGAAGGVSNGMIRTVSQVSSGNVGSVSANAQIGSMQPGTTVGAPGGSSQQGGQNGSGMPGGPDMQGGQGAPGMPGQGGSNMAGGQGVPGMPGGQNAGGPGMQGQGNAMNCAKQAFRGKLDSAVSQKLKQHLQERLQKLQTRLGKLTEAHTGISKALQGAKWTDNGDGTESLHLTFSVSQTVNGATLQRSVDSTRTRNTSDQTIVEVKDTFTESLSNGQKRTAMRDKLLNQDGTYTVTFHSELSLPNGDNRVADLSETIAADGTVTGNGTVNWTQANGVPFQTAPVTVSGDEDAQQGSVSGAGSDIQPAADGADVGDTGDQSGSTNADASGSATASASAATTGENANSGNDGSKS
ncbi:MAG TPA: hypothetical protein V6D47_20185 [Oscillatoriaceae cyanobacterium]